MVYLPRDKPNGNFRNPAWSQGDAGWSGGWREFAIDHMLGPNDTGV